MAVLQMLKLHPKKEKVTGIAFEWIGLITSGKSGFQLAVVKDDDANCTGSCNESEIYSSRWTLAGVDPIAVEDIMNIVANLKLKGSEF